MLIGGGGGASDPYTDLALLAETGLVAGKPVVTRGLPLTTKKGTPIPNIQRMEQPPPILEAYLASAMKVGPSVSPRSLSATYNCVGLVFGGRRVEIDAGRLDEMLLSDDGYRLLAGPSEAKRGDVIVYRKARGAEAEHVGLIWSVTPSVLDAAFKVVVLSQWGLTGEYFHDEHEVPASYGTHRDYYTDRKGLP